MIQKHFFPAINKSYAPAANPRLHPTHSHHQKHQNPLGGAEVEVADMFSAVIPLSTGRIKKFAARLKIHPGIVAGRLCHDKKIGWNVVDSLRIRFKVAANHPPN